MKKIKENKGITLIALIITIVVLMILAIVTINAVNDGGLFTKAGNASKSYQIEAEKEAIKLAVSEWKMKKYDNTANQTFSQYMQERFNGNGYRCEEIDERTVKITGPSKSQYTVKEDGTINIEEPGIILSKPTIGILPGQTVTIEVILVGGLEGERTFTSSDPSTITATSAGVVAIAENPVGTEATITVSCGGHTATCKVYIADQGDFTYSYNSTNKTASVIGLSSVGEAKIAEAVTTLSMPDTIIYNDEEYTITSIGTNAFYNGASGYPNLNLSNLPSELTNIEGNAFFKATNLTLTELPDGITSIGNAAFNRCTNLALTKLPSGLTSIKNMTFNECTNLALTSLPSGITSIGAQAFYSCTNLALTSLPRGITSIEQYAFDSCTNLALTELPSGVTSIGSDAFSNCANLALTELPNGLISLGKYAFSKCTSITNITLPSSLTTVGKNVFQGCDSTLQNIYVKELELAPEGWDTNWANTITSSKIHWAQ